MKKKELTILQIYIETHIPVKELKQAGFFQSKDPKQEYNYIKNNRDYEAIARRVCHWFSLKNIYEYSKIGTEEWYKAKDKEKSVEYTPCKEWIMQDNRLISLIENN